ncbi:primary active transporter [Lithospermum erythrorhizon]|uniref:Primary active transporter n=1 Tax=Lithospermum erythrorhizon TaxID=34254 RepID=A0AAV3Q2T0_LITER
MESVVPPPSPSKLPEKMVDYMDLPCPIPFEEIHREALRLNQRFSLSHSVFMGPTEIPSQSTETIKVPTAHYEFGANFIDPKLMLLGRIMTDGRLSARLKCDLAENLTMKANAQLTNEPHMSQGMFNFDYKGSDYRAQLQLGNGGLVGASYIQSVTPNLSLGGEIFWAGQQRKSGISYAARSLQVTTGQVASTGMVALSYVQKVSEKVSLASNFMYNYMSGDVTSSFGYDYILRQCRLRGKIDSNGCVAAFLEERLNMGLNFILSAELDHRKKDYKFGFGLTVGE